MNDELKTKEYLKKSLESLRLADSSRLRIREELLAHAQFHTVQEVAVPVKSPFAWLFLKPTQAAFAFVLMLGAGAAIYFGGATLSTAPLASNEAPSVEDSAAPTLTPASETPDSATVDKLAVAPTPITNSSGMNSDTASYDDVARSVIMKESADTAGDEAMMTTMLSQGELNIDDYRADIVLREKTYRGLINKYEKEIGTDTTNELTTKFNAVATLLKDAEGKEDSEARPFLDKAMAHIGEIESTLSLLGTVTIEESMIVDIKFTTEVQ